LRSILAGLNGIESEDVTEGQIELAATELVRYYGRVQIAPAAPGDLVPAVDLTSPFQDSAFWKEREVEFSRSDAAPNTLLSATWFSWGNYWSFHANTTSSAPADVVDLFKSLAREAARGVGSSRGSQSWMDWLDLLCNPPRSSPPTFSRSLPPSFSESWARQPMGHWRWDRDTRLCRHSEYPTPASLKIGAPGKRAGRSSRLIAQGLRSGASPKKWAFRKGWSG
jgi:hypothetical protein